MDLTCIYLADTASRPQRTSDSGTLAWRLREGIWFDGHQLDALIVGTYAARRTDEA